MICSEFCIMFGVLSIDSEVSTDRCSTSSRLVGSFGFARKKESEKSFTVKNRWCDTSLKSWPYLRLENRKKKQKKNRRATGTGCAENCAKLHSIIKVSAVRRQFSGLFAPNLTRLLQSRCDQLAFSDCRRARSRSLRFTVILRLFLTAGAVFESLDFSRYSIYSFFLARFPSLRQQARSLEDLFMFFRVRSSKSCGVSEWLCLRFKFCSIAQGFAVVDLAIFL
jgi:hypothetical protein